ncbi:MAG: hypothetical protein IJ879_08435 [Muribaculaceae bacterium]|nr:hypothetical protein [Muribaculaceae bacterium]
MTMGAGVHRMPRREEENSQPQVPTMGSPRIPIILANYTDVRFIDDDPVVTFENQSTSRSTVVCTILSRSPEVRSHRVSTSWAPSTCRRTVLSMAKTSVYSVPRSTCNWAP